MSQSEVVLITGANTGLGYQIVRALYSSDKAYDIIVGGRTPSKVEEAITSVQAEFTSSKSKLSPLQVDIEQDDSIKKAFNEVESKFGRLDALINNAGTQLDQQVGLARMTEREMWNQSWNINTVGTQIMTSTFAPLLIQASNPRLLFITSGTSTLAGSENQALHFNKYSPKGWPKPNFDGKNYNLPAYRSSKAGMNMMMRDWYRALHEDGVKVWCVSPGWLATGLGVGTETNKQMGALDPAIGGQIVKNVVEGGRDADVGKIVLREGVQPW